MVFSYEAVLSQNIRKPGMYQLSIPTRGISRELSMDQVFVYLGEHMPKGILVSDDIGWVDNKPLTERLKREGYDWRITGN